MLQLRFLVDHNCWFLSSWKKRWNPLFLRTKVMWLLIYMVYSGSFFNLCPRSYSILPPQNPDYSVIDLNYEMERGFLVSLVSTCVLPNASMTKCCTHRCIGKNTSWHQTDKKTPLHFIVQIYHWIIWVLWGKNGVASWTQVEEWTRVYHIDQQSHNFGSEEESVSPLLSWTEESAIVVN